MKIRIAVLLAALVATLYVTHAKAESYSASDAKGNNIVLTEAPCPDVGWIKLFMARFNYNGKNLKACWMAAGDSVLLFDETGDVFTVPKSAFKKDQSV